MNAKITLTNSQVIECRAFEIGRYSDLTSVKVVVSWDVREQMKNSKPTKLELGGVEKAFREFYIEGCIFDLDKQVL